MVRWALGCVFFWTCSQAALATTLAPQNGSSNEVVEYQRAMAKIEAMSARGTRVSNEFFKGLNWVGRTAAINYMCSVKGASDCRQTLAMGLSDRALVVRDYAFRLVLASDKYVPEEKSQIARDVLDDSRNYRSGEPLWIVGRARKYLEAFKG